MLKNNHAVWKGPDGKTTGDYKKHFYNLCSHPSLKKLYSPRTLTHLQKRLEKADDYIQNLYMQYDLLSPYHTYSHNIVTCVTAFRIFLGRLMMDKTCSLKDLQTLLFAAMFHDTGYLHISELQKNTRARFMHVEVSFQIVKRFLSLEFKWNDKRIYDVIELQRLTEYRFAESALNNIGKLSCGSLMIGSDILQVADINYTKNLAMLSELLFTRNQQRNIQNQMEFFSFTKKATSFVWDYLDTFYGGDKKNPYRKGWSRYVRYMKNQLQG